MKPIVKLVFAILMICVALTLPKIAHASQMYCESPGINECEGAATEGMEQCVATCRESGASSTVYFCVYQVNCTDCKGGVCGSCDVDGYCDTSQGVNPSCMQICLDTYQPQFNACTSEYCYTD